MPLQPDYDAQCQACHNNVPCLSIEQAHVSVPPDLACETNAFASIAFLAPKLVREGIVQVRRATRVALLTLQDVCDRCCLSDRGVQSLREKRLRGLGALAPWRRRRGRTRRSSEVCSAFAVGLSRCEALCVPSGCPYGICVTRHDVMFHAGIVTNTQR